MVRLCVRQLPSSAETSNVLRLAQLCQRRWCACHKRCLRGLAKRL